MTRTAPRLLAAALLLGAAACADTTGSQAGPDLDAAFTTLPAGFTSTLNTFAGSDSSWTPEGRHGRGGRGGHGGGMMGGGLGGIFLGDGLGHHGHHPFGAAFRFADCPFDAASGRLVCPTVTRDGLTIQRSAALADAGGNVQQAFDSVTTNTVNTRVSVTGTRTRRDGASSTVQHGSDRTVSGLADGSTRRTVNGTSAGSETTTGTDSTGAFTVVRVVGDSITGVVIPVPSDSVRHPYPVAGTIVRSMRVTVTYTGQAAATRTRREVITFDGDDTATLVITVNGETKTCTLPLPYGRPTCQ